jgi:hypothetical protein
MSGGRSVLIEHGRDSVCLKAWHDYVASCTHLRPRGDCPEWNDILTAQAGSEPRFCANTKPTATKVRATIFIISFRYPNLNNRISLMGLGGI